MGANAPLWSAWQALPVKDRGAKLRTYFGLPGTQNPWPQFHALPPSQRVQIIGQILGMAVIPHEPPPPPTSGEVKAGTNGSKQSTVTMGPDDMGALEGMADDPELAAQATGDQRSRMLKVGGLVLGLGLLAWWAWK